MFETEINILKEQFRLNEKFNQSTFVVSDFVESDLGFEGITDQYPNWIYVEVEEGTGGRSYEFFPADPHSDFFIAKCDARIVASVQHSDSFKLIQYIVGVIKKYNHEVFAAGSNPFLIHADLTGEDLKTNIPLVVVYFQMTKALESNVCDIDFC